MLSKSNFSIETAVANQSGAMEAETISKNGQSSKSHKSRGNMFLTLIIASIVITAPAVGVFAQDIVFPSKDIENFQGNKFGWQEIKAKGSATIKKGYYEITSNTKVNVIGVTAYANLPVNIKNNFKISVKFQLVKWDKSSVFAVLLNSATIRLAVSENDLAAIINNNTIACQELRKTMKGDTVTLSIGKEGTNWFFYYNDTLVCTSEQQQQTNSEIRLNLLGSSQVNVLEVIVEH